MLHIFLLILDILAQELTIAYISCYGSEIDPPHILSDCGLEGTMMLTGAPSRIPRQESSALLSVAYLASFMSSLTCSDLEKLVE
jgi:hypothetical protein